MADIMVAKKCPRRAALSGDGGIHKTSVLRSVAKEVTLEIAARDFAAKTAEVQKLVKTAIDARSHNMLDFEVKAEIDRMVQCLDSYASWERTHGKHKVVATDFEHGIPFGIDTDGTLRQKHCHVDILIDRGDCLESVRYTYKNKTYGDVGRSSATMEDPGNSAELLLLQRAGEKEAVKLGYDISKTPVFGAVFFLRRKKKYGGVASELLEFEEKEGTNIASFFFSRSQGEDVIKKYQTIHADPKVGCGDPAYCRSCAYDELCHVEFSKRDLTVLPPEKPIPIDDIHMTDAQRNFVTFRHGECRVNAVAGSGKTTILVLRAISMLEEGVDPKQILMMTFTDKAADEMRTRLQAYASGLTLKDEGLDVSSIEVGTFNSWGQHILDEHFEELGFTQKPELIDDVVKKDIIIDILKKHQTLPLDYNNPFMSSFSHQGAVIEMLQLIDAMKAAHVKTASDVLGIVGGASSTMGPRAAELLEIYESYNERLVAENLLDYEDQLRLLLDLDRLGIFKKMPYAHVVVDEFQDSNPNQIDIIRRMVAQLPNYQSMAVVGDVMQSIYGFRNATPENLSEFGKYFPHMVDISMTDNFRSFTPIVKLANKIIEEESDIKSTIVAHKLGHGLDPVLMRVADKGDETRLFVAQTKKLIRDGADPASIAVICRTRGELVNLRDAMAEAGIPVIMRVPEIVGEAPYVKAIIALARYVAAGDKVALALYAKSLGLDPFDSASVDKLGTEITDKMNALTSDKAKRELFWSLCDDACEDFMAAQFVENIKAKRHRSLNRMLAYIVKYQQYGTKEMHSTALEKSNSVTLITVHSAKGLEWPVVLLSTKGFRYKGSKDAAEEKRLLYVAITRAKEKLLVTYTDKQQPLISLLQ